MEVEPPSWLPPATWSDVFAAGTTLYFTRFFATLAITLVVWVTAELVNAYVEYYLLDSEDIRGAMQLSWVLEMTVGLVAVASVIHPGAAAIRGERLAWWVALGRGLASAPRLFATRLVVGVALLTALCLLVVPYL